MPTPPKPSMTEGNVDSSTIMQEAAVLHELAHELDAGSECSHTHRMRRLFHSSTQTVKRIAAFR